MAELLANTGRDAGRRFALADDVTKMGRQTENDIVLRDASVSRFHAQILRRDDGYCIRDVGSAVGTFVNGEQVAGEVVLRDGDLIRVGQTELVFASARAGQPPPDVSSAGPMQRLPSLRGDPRAQPLRETSITLSLPSTPETAAQRLSGQRAEVLSRVAEAIRSVSKLEELLGALLNVIFDVFGPDRGVILLREAAGGELVPKVTRPEQGELVVSRSIVDYAIEHRMCLLVADTAGDERFRGAQSIQAQSIQAAICSPLICKDKVLGALYIDTQIDLLSYGKEDLALLNVIAANAAIAIENAILIRERQEADRLAEGEPGPLFAESASMGAMEERIAELCRGSGPILITGEAGTGKFFAAQTIHGSTAGRNAPLVRVDCLTLVRDQAGRVLFGSGPTDGFAEPASNTERTSVQDGGALHRADRGTLVLRHIGALDLATQETLSRYLEAQAGGERVSPQTRLIATTSEDLASLVRAGRFFAPLAERLSANLLEMPPLRNRKEDILPLARYFLSRCERRLHEYEPELNRSAERALRSLQYRHRNVAELREAVELAAVIADGPEIGGEYVFTGPKDTGGRIEYDLGETALVPWLARKAVSRILQSAALLFFLALAAICLAAGGTPAGQAANALVWGLWWPAMIVLFLFVGRVWCPFCPISKAGQVARNIGSLNRPPPQWMKKGTSWITALLFLAIIWSEHVFRMPENPAATGIFLLTLMAFSVILCILYAREVWCRYVCPLGSLSAGYAVSSLIHVHATASICATECRTHECFKGTESEAGCPVYHHPLYVRDAHFCKLCLTCVRTCPHRSTRVYLRPLLRDVWRTGDLSVTLVPFALVAFLLIPVMLASHRAVLGLSGVGGFTAAACLAVAGAAGLHAALPRMLARGGDLTVTARVSFALLVLAWGPLMAFHLENIPGWDALQIHAAAGSFWARQFPALEVSLLSLLQLGIVFVAATLAAITLGRIRVHAAKQGTEIVPWGWRILLGICAVYLLAAVVLVFLGEVSP